jgi:hypothetical protein
MADLPTRTARVDASVWPMVMTGVAALLALIALTQPLWAFQTEPGGGNVDKTMYTWTARVEEEWRNGTLARTTITQYASPTFTEFRIRDAAVTTYYLGAAYALLLVVLGALQFGLRRERISRAAVFGAHVAVVAVGIAALAYAVFTIPPAARIDVDPAVAGFWGQATVGGELLSWGPGLAWWLWAVSAVLALIAFAVPLHQQRAWAQLVPTR